ncbi:uncharacterized protein BKA55DRAFT_546335 [Fusarium redolens]|uniref:Uncharacterized protein n=1 Tax=Fusarium redolens TaxID=48865 RepID=A0A9P9FYF8_FUSRE|nr:uncharacterized protein BKA55DRAFT_546335 [Fusarium redolens]KAH7216901.1 hypothetical protein BKA55DRAFT_546335 [Fusarium redolens]
MLSLPKEGFTIDFVAKLVRCIILNPAITILLAISSYGASFHDPIHSYWSHKSDALRPYIYYLTAFSLLLHLTDFLNTRYNNNWTTDLGWDWNNEIVVITGGSSGIGAHLARQLHARNPNTKVVIIDYVPLTWEPLEGAYTKYYQCDLSDSSQIRLICEEIRAEVGHPTVLVNNAGICRGATVCDGSYADVEATMRTNLTAPFLLVKEFGPDMVRRNHGHIINISSMSAFLPPAKVADYAATKAGLIALHEALQLELKESERVRLSLVVLGFTRTPLFKGETNQSNFLFPLLHVESVSEEIAKTLWSGYGKTIFMPGIMRYIAILKGGPEWLWLLARKGTGSTRVDFKGRQKLDPKTGALLQL